MNKNITFLNRDITAMNRLISSMNWTRCQICTVLVLLDGCLKTRSAFFEVYPTIFLLFLHLILFFPVICHGTMLEIFSSLLETLQWRETIDRRKLIRCSQTFPTEPCCTLALTLALKYFTSSCKDNLTGNLKDFTRWRFTCCHTCKRGFKRSRYIEFWQLPSLLNFSFYKKSILEFDLWLCMWAQHWFYLQARQESDIIGSMWEGKRGKEGVWKVSQEEKEETGL